MNLLCCLLGHSYIQEAQEMDIFPFVRDAPIIPPPLGYEFNKVITTCYTCTRCCKSIFNVNRFIKEKK